jgi:hypothetical protein
VIHECNQDSNNAVYGIVLVYTYILKEKEEKKEEKKGR